MQKKELKYNLASFWDISLNAPWKLINEILMYSIKPFVLLSLFAKGVKIGNGAKFYGFPKILKYKGSVIEIGDNFEARSWKFSNPIGINHPVILCTWEKNAKIIVGNNVGISGGSIVSASDIEIGDGTIIGANSTITDTNFHPLKGEIRYAKENVGISPVTIGNNVFIGMNSIILKGNKIKDNSIIGAGEVVRNG